jgi:hypothetical protein
MRELRLFDDRPDHNVRAIQNCQEYAGDNDTMFKLTTSSESFTWSPSLTACMMHFLHFLRNSNKKLVVRLHGFKADDTNLQEWFCQACDWELIGGLVTNSVSSHVKMISHALEQHQHQQQQCIPSMSMKLYIYPVDFTALLAFQSLENSLRDTSCLNSLELQILNLGNDDAIARSLAQGIQDNTSIKHLILSAWGTTSLALFLRSLSLKRMEQYPLRSLEINRWNFEQSLIQEQQCSSALRNLPQLVISSCRGVQPNLFALDSKLTYLQLTRMDDLTTNEIDQWMTQLATTCPNLSTLDVRDNRIQSLEFKRYFAASGSGSTTTRLKSLREFYLDGNPLLYSRDKCLPADCLFRLLSTHSQLTTFFHPEQQQRNITKQEARQKLKHIKLIKIVRSFAQPGSSDYATELPVGAWPLLLEHANRLLKGSSEYQAAAIYPFLLNASAVLGNQTTSSNYRGIIKIEDDNPCWWSFKKILRGWGGIKS